MRTEPILIEPRVFKDNRGWFQESYNRNRLREEYGIDNDWMQDNHSFSKKHVIRGIHYQLDGQAKLVRCLTGRIIDVIVDLRRGLGFGSLETYDLSADNGRTLYVPPGFGHSFLALESSQVLYKVDRPWNKELERGVRYNDPELAIPWSDFSFSGPIEKFHLSDKDLALPLLSDADKPEVER